MEQTICEKRGSHERIVIDRFARDFGGRKMPGDCFCLDCKEPIPAYWNKGHPVAVEKSFAAATEQPQ